jgi:hypothetical protein
MQQITVFIDLQDQLNRFRTKFAHFEERKPANYACGMVSCCSGGLAVRRAAKWHYVLGVKGDG